MTKLHDLPNEVIDLIFAHQDPPSLADYRLCCKAACKQANPRAMSIKACDAGCLVRSELMAHARGGLTHLKIAWEASDLPDKHTQYCTDLVQLVVQHRTKFKNVTHLELLGCRGKLMSLTGVLPSVMPGLTHLKAVNCKYAARLECMLAINRFEHIRCLEFTGDPEGIKLSMEIPEDWHFYDRRAHMQLSIENHDIFTESSYAFYVDTLNIANCEIGRGHTYDMLFEARSCKFVGAFCDTNQLKSRHKIRDTVPMESLHVEESYDIAEYIVDHPFLIRGVRTATLLGYTDTLYDDLWLDDLWSYAAPTLQHLTLHGHYFQQIEPGMRALSELLTLTWYIKIENACSEEYGFLAATLGGMRKLQRLELVIVTYLADTVDFTQPEFTDFDDAYEEFEDLEDTDFRSNIMRICKGMPSLNHLLFRVQNTFDIDDVVSQTLHDGPVP